jgi:protein-L-isoaspartate(D-aspartate) O-methyltransferase
MDENLLLKGNWAIIMDIVIDESAFTSQRSQMVDEQIFARGIRDLRLLDALRSVPRHLFVPHRDRYLAYTDGPLLIGHNQTISQPYIVALMTELLDLKGEETVLEVGTGSGYQAAILGLLAREVHTIERHPELAERAQGVLEEIGLANVHVHVGDGSVGLEAHAPYQAVIVTAAAPSVPQPLFDQLAEGGRLVLPVGSLGGQMLERWVRGKDQFIHRSITAVAFVPLRGEYGWEEDW